MTESQTNQPVDITARAGRYYRNARYVIVLLFLCFGVWCIRDGYFVYPRENLEARQADPPKAEPHPGFDIPFNQTLGVILPPLSLLVLAWALYNSRGAYRLSGDTLQIPGHPAISLNDVRKIDKRLWERKGIAYLDYEIPGTSRLGRFKLDDFVYERAATDQILEHIEAHVQRQAGTTADDVTADESRG